MNSKIRINVFLLLIFAAITAELKAQPSKRELVDSLQTAIDNSIFDTTKVSLLNRASKIARGYNIVQARSFAKEALMLSKQIGFSKGQIESAINYARVCHRLGDDLEAFKSFGEALELANEENDDFQKLVIYNHFSVMYMNYGMYEKSAENAFLALDYAEALNLDKGRAAIYINIANIYINQSDLSKAEEYLYEALGIAKRINHEKKEAIVYINLSNIKSKQEDADSAMFYILLAEEIYKRHNDWRSLAHINYNIGDIYLSEKKEGKAQEYYNKALMFANMLNDSLLLCDVENKLANYYYECAHYDSSLYYAHKAYEISSKYRNIPNIIESSQVLYEIYALTNDFGKAFTFQGINLKMKDSIRAIESIDVLENAEARHLIGKYEKEIELAGLKREMVVTKSIAAVVAIIFLSAIVLLISNRKRLQVKKDKQIYKLKLQKANSIIQQKKEELETSAMKIIEDNKKIEKLHQEVASLRIAENKDGVREKVEELRNIKVLTEDDWSRFKSLFNDLYPSFLEKANLDGSSLSDGDIRQLMLIKLDFSISQSADFLGVGYKAIQKARQRLAQKLNLPSAKELNTLFINKNMPES